MFLPDDASSLKHRARLTNAPISFDQSLLLGLGLDGEPPRDGHIYMGAGLEADRRMLRGAFRSAVRCARSTTRVSRSKQPEGIMLQMLSVEPPTETPAMHALIGT
jgi:hypothetical protein